MVTVTVSFDSGLVVVVDADAEAVTVEDEVGALVLSTDWCNVCAEAWVEEAETVEEATEDELRRAEEAELVVDAVDDASAMLSNSAAAPVPGVALVSFSA